VDVSPIFPTAGPRAGMYESFYLRAFAPEQPLGVWIRHTVHKRPAMAPTGSIWCTVFDARREAPFMAKSSSPGPVVPSGGWISVGGQATFGPGLAEGGCGEASWSLSFTTAEPPLHHLSPEWLYRAPLPRTKLTSPAPAARFSGRLTIAGEEPISLEEWPGMVGHNWGAEHAERWIWLHGVGFEEDPTAWLDVALGRVKVAGRLTPWLANGALSLGGVRHRLGGLSARGLQVRESAQGLELTVGGEGGLVLEATVGVPMHSSAGWRYADPRGGEHDVLNCSVAAVELRVRTPGGGAPTVLTSVHGGAYELGMREQNHGVPIAPFEDG